VVISWNLVVVRGSEVIQSEHWPALELLGIHRHRTTSSVAAPWVCAGAELAIAEDVVPAGAGSVIGIHERVSRPLIRARP